MFLVGHGETRRLWKHIEPYFRTVMNRVYLRESSLSDLDSVTTTSSSSTLTELPYHSKYLLLASFLASYNPSRVDRRFFSKVQLEMTWWGVSLHCSFYQLKQPKLRKPHGHRAPKEVSSRSVLLACCHDCLHCSKVCKSWGLRSLVWTG